MNIAVHPYPQFSDSTLNVQTIGTLSFRKDALNHYSLVYSENPEKILKNMLKEEAFRDFSRFTKGDKLHITEENLAQYHEFAQKYKIPILLEVTTPFSIFIKLVNDAVYTIWSDDINDQEFMKKSADFLASVFPLFIKTSIFSKLRMKDLEVIYSSPKMSLLSSDIILSSLTKFVTKGWSDWKWIEGILESKKFTKESIDSFIECAAGTEMESLKDHLICDMNKSESDDSKFDTVWKEFVNFLSPI